MVTAVNVIVVGDVASAGAITVNETLMVAVELPVLAENVTVAVYVPAASDPVVGETVIVCVPLAASVPDVGEIESQPEPLPYVILLVQAVPTPCVSDRVSFCDAGFAPLSPAENVSVVGEVESAGAVVTENVTAMVAVAPPVVAVNVTVAV